MEEKPTSPICVGGATFGFEICSVTYLKSSYYLTKDPENLIYSRLSRVSFIWESPSDVHLSAVAEPAQIS